MSSMQGAASGVVVLAALGAAAIEAIKPAPEMPPVVITELRWNGERIIYERAAEQETLGTWTAVVLTEGTETEVCSGGSRATYEKGSKRHVWSLDTLTEDKGCSDRIPPGEEVYVMVTITPLNGALPYSKRTGPFKLKP